MKRTYWHVFWPTQNYRLSDPKDYRAWPAEIEKKFSKHRAGTADDSLWLNAGSPLIDELVSLFRRERGAEPYSYVVGKYRFSEPAVFKFFFFGVRDWSWEVADGTNYENQMMCGNPAPEILRKNSKGCGQGKKQIEPFRVESKRRLPKYDVCSFSAGPRLPVGRVLAISERMREAIAHYSITGCETQPILDERGEGPSGFHQLTIVGSTSGAERTSVALRSLRKCEVCGYLWARTADPPLAHRVLDDEFFSEVDLQVCDRLAIGGREVYGGDSPSVFMSAKFVQMYRDCGLTGLSKVNRFQDLWPVTIKSELDELEMGGGKQRSGNR